MKENKVVIEMNVSEFLKLRVLLGNIYQLIEEVDEFMKLARKYSAKFPNIRVINEQLCYISDSISSVKDSDAMKLFLRLGSYSDEEK